MRRAIIKIYLDEKVSSVDPRIYGSFVEHFGRCVYHGIYQPEHPSADAQGFREDVISYVRELAVPIVRYPGGNFVSGYRWEDGVGPLTERPTRLDLAWRAVEPNRVGVDEFAAWARKADTQVMMSVNLGTRGIDAARNLVEYCNCPKGSLYADLRIKNGTAQPHGFKTWCLGNEMDGDWQIAHREAEDYARLAAEAGKAMKRVDPSLELVACGSSSAQMASYPDWDRTVLETSYEVADYISLHTYYDDMEGDTKSFLAAPLLMEDQIKMIASVCDYVKAKKRGKKNIYLSTNIMWDITAEKGTRSSRKSRGNSRRRRQRTITQ